MNANVQVVVVVEVDIWCAEISQHQDSSTTFNSHPKPKPMHQNVRLAFVTLSWLPVLYTALEYGYSPCHILGMSMTPTFNPATETTAKDIVLVRKFMLRSPGVLQRGDIVMFRSPYNPEQLLTKRITGVQGDKIEPRARYARKGNTVVPRNHLWVEGDNEFHSIDSNTFGPVSLGLVVGKVVLLVWPPSRWGTDLTKGGRDARVKPQSVEEA